MEEIFTSTQKNRRRRKHVFTTSLQGKKKLVKQTSRITGINEEDTEMIVRVFFKVLRDTLCEGKSVVIPEFGKFYHKWYRAKSGIVFRNQKAVKAILPERYELKFEIPVELRNKMRETMASLGLCPKFIPEEVSEETWYQQVKSV